MGIPDSISGAPVAEGFLQALHGTEWSMGGPHKVGGAQDIPQSAGAEPRLGLGL